MIASIAVLCLGLAACPAPDKVAVTVTVTRETSYRDCLRLGVNLPGPNDYGAENYLRNLLPNPGFEPGCWGSVATLHAATDSREVQSMFWDTAWHTPEIGQDEHLWQGGEWELPRQGLSGMIVDFIHAPVGSGAGVVRAYTWVLDQPVTVADYEPLVVRITRPAEGPPPRPGSSGRQSRFIASPGNAWESVGRYFFDTQALHGAEGDGGCGPLRVLRGPHELRFWAKGPATLSFEITRGNRPVASMEFALSSAWREYTSAFDPDDPYASGETPPLSIGWKVLEGDGFYLDDMFLGPAGVGVFADEVVDTVKFLRPGVIRGWQGFHGDSLDNLLGDEFARGPREYRPRGKRATAYGYGIPDLLELCYEVDALPWIVLPPTLSDVEMARFGVFIEPWAEEFDTIYVEFGNESWGTNNPFDDPFAGASFFGGHNLGVVAREKFEAMGEVPGVVKVIGGQAAWAGQNEAIRMASGDEYLIPIAPYFGKLNDRYATAADMFYPLYARAYEDVTTGKPQQTEHVAGAVYEINFHTTGGAGGDKDRVNTFVAGQAGGIALPLYCLNYLRGFGWQPQTVYSLAQYSAGGVRIWGIYRDIMATGRARPTGLAVALVNRAIAGDMVRVDIAGAKTFDVPAVNGLDERIEIPALDAFAWRDEDQWSLVVFNLDVDEGEAVELPGLEPDEAWILTAGDPLATNEDDAQVTIEPFQWVGVIPAHSMVVLRGQER